MQSNMKLIEWMFTNIILFIFQAYILEIVSFPSSSGKSLQQLDRLETNTNLGIFDGIALSSWIFYVET